MPPPSLPLPCLTKGCHNTKTSLRYETRFGVTFVDYTNGQQRHPKKSALELQNIFKKYIGKLPAKEGGKEAEKEKVNGEIANGEATQTKVPSVETVSVEAVA